MSEGSSPLGSAPAIKPLFRLPDCLPVWCPCWAGSQSALSLPPGRDPRRLARLRRNLVSLLPFLFIVVNTFPATPIVLTTLLRFVPRHLIIPAAYDEQRLEAYHRLRKIRVR